MSRDPVEVLEEFKERIKNETWVVPQLQRAVLSGISMSIARLKEDALNEGTSDSGQGAG